MGYNKTTWADRAVATAKRYMLTLISGSTYDIDAVPGTITNAGTVQTAARMNNIENAIEASHNGTHIYGASATGTDAYEISFSTPFTAVNSGLTINMLADVANAGSATLKVDSNAVKNIKKIISTGKVNLDTGDIFAGTIAILTYDGVDFVLINPQSNFMRAAASSNVKLTANTQRSVNGTTHVLVKQFKVKYAGTYRVAYQIKGSGFQAHANIISSMSNVDQYTTETTFQSLSTDIICMSGDTISIYIYSSSTYDAYIQNCTIGADYSAISVDAVTQD